LKAGLDDDFYGQLESMPILLKPLGLSPPSLLVKIPVMTKDQAAFSAPAELSALVAKKKIAFEINDGSAWLSLYDVSIFPSTEAVIAVVKWFVTRLREMGLVSSSACCQTCGQETVLHVLYEDGKLTQQCAACVDASLDRHVKAEQSRQKGQPAYLLALPIVILVSSLIWAAWWALYDYVVSSVETIWLPRLVAVLIIAGVGIAMAKPLVVIFQRAPRGRLSVRALLVLALILTVVFGELFFVTILLVWHAHVFDPMSALAVLPRIVAQYSLEYVLVKCIFFGSLSIASFTMIRPKPRQIDVM
jgi:hypothetical protein